MFSVPTEYTIFRLFIGVLEDAEYTEQLAAEFSLGAQGGLLFS